MLWKRFELRFQKSDKQWLLFQIYLIKKPANVARPRALVLSFLSYFRLSKEQRVQVKLKNSPQSVHKALSGTSEGPLLGPDSAAL